VFPGCGSFVVAALDRLQDVAGLGDTRPVNLGLRLRLYLRRIRGRASAPAMEVDANAFRFISFKRTGMGLLFRYANCGQNVQNFPAFNFQFSS
jgi:hypothetical protein